MTSMTQYVNDIHPSHIWCPKNGWNNLKLWIVRFARRYINLLPCASIYLEVKIIYIKQAKKLKKLLHKSELSVDPFPQKACGWCRDVCMDGASHLGHYCPISSLERSGACQVWGVCPLPMVCPAPRVFNRPGYNTTMCGKPFNKRQLRIAILDQTFFWLLIMQHIHRVSQKCTYRTKS